MSINPEQFAAANKATVDSLLSVANTALASAERIAALNLNTVRSATLEDSVSGAKSVMAAKDPQEALKLQSSLAQPAVEKAVAYSRSVYEITTQTQQELAKMVEAQFGDFQKSMAGMVEMATKSAPAGSESAVAAIQNAIAAATSAFGNMNSVDQAICRNRSSKHRFCDQEDQVIFSGFPENKAPPVLRGFFHFGIAFSALTDSRSQNA
jgi:phasin family protein